MLTVFAEHKYPPDQIHGIPDDGASTAAKHAFCKQRIPAYYPPKGCGATELTEKIICDLYRICDFPASWSPEFHPMGDAFSNWELGNAILKTTGKSMDHVLFNHKFGDQPGWMLRPSQEIIFCQQKCPKTPEELEAVAISFRKSVFGKSKDLIKTSCLDGPTSVPLALVFHGTFPLKKGSTFQIVYDCSNEGKRIVVPISDFSEECIRNEDDSHNSTILTIQLPATTTAEIESSMSFNKMLIPEPLFKVTRVDYTNLIHLRQCLRRWLNGRLSWIDLSTT